MAGPDPVVATARRAVRTALVDLADGDLVLVACSGGADSLALAAVTAFVAPRAGWRAGAIVVDHGLQAGSADVARRAADQCAALGLDAQVRRVVVRESGDGPEAEARTARYAALRAAAVDAGAVAVLLGHTLDDQAESVLLALARGSGARSLAGMAARRGVLRRPFLGLRRSETEEVCRVHGIDFWTDPTNGVSEPGCAGAHPGSDTPVGLPLRSRVRTEVLPVLREVLGPRVVPALARSADLLRDDADLLDALAADLLDRARAGSVPPDVGSPPGVGAPPDAGSPPAATPSSGRTADPAPGPGVVLDVPVLAAAPRALRRRALRAAAIEAGCPPGDLFAVHVEALNGLVARWRGQGSVHLPGDRRGTRSYGRLLLQPPAP